MMIVTRCEVVGKQKCGVNHEASSSGVPPLSRLDHGHFSSAFSASSKHSTAQQQDGWQDPHRNLAIEKETAFFVELMLCHHTSVSYPRTMLVVHPSDLLT